MRLLGVMLMAALVTSASAKSVGKPKAAKAPAVVGLALGNTHTCLRLSDGTVTCLGNDFSDAGPPAVTPHWGGFTGVQALSAGGVATCAVTKTEARCLLMGAPGGPPALPAKTVQVAISNDLGCARSADGHLACWGSDLAGDGVVGVRATPVVLAGLEHVEDVVMGAYGRACARLQGGAVRCWGHADPLGPAAADCHEEMCPGGCGHGPPPGAVGAGRGAGPILVAQVPATRVCAAPIEVPQLEGALRVALSPDQTCGVFKDGSVSCLSSAGLAKLAGLDHVADLVFGFGFGCARISDGTVRCFGNNDLGQLGDGKLENYRAAPKPVAGLAGVVELAAGQSHVCARTKAGAVLCWGSNHPGQLGDGTRLDRAVPTPIKR